MQDLRIFSQGEEEQSQAVAFDVVYESEPTIGKIVGSGERDPLFDLLTH
jgi:hypothetical protein